MLESLSLHNLFSSIFLAITSLGMGILAIIVYRANRHSATNTIFTLLSLSILLWLFSGYMACLPQMVTYSIVFHRLGIFFAAPMSVLFFLLAYVIPNEKLPMKKRNVWIVIILTVLMMIVNISPYAFLSNSSGTNLVPGFGIIPFSIISSVFSFLAIYYLFKKYRTAEKQEKLQLRVVLIGILIMLILIIGTILIPIIFFQSIVFLPFLSVYVLIFLLSISYAIYKYKLFNLKIIAIELSMFGLWMFVLVRFILMKSPDDFLSQTLLFGVTVIFGVVLVRNIFIIIGQAEQIEQLTVDLHKAYGIINTFNSYLTEAEDVFKPK